MTIRIDNDALTWGLCAFSLLSGAFLVWQMYYRLQMRLDAICRRLGLDPETGKPDPAQQPRP